MRLVALIAALGLVAAVGGCGSGDESEDGGAPARQEPAAFQERAGRICSDVVDQMTALKGRTREALRRAGDDPAKTARIDAREFRVFTKLVNRLRERLNPLAADAPDPAAFRAYLAHLEELAKLTKSIGEFIAADRSREAIAGFGEINKELEKGEAAAERLKLAPCAEVPSPSL